MPALEVAEDIHRPTVEAAVDWRWETFADYLAVVDALPKGVNFGACVGHGALRSSTMGDRAYDEEPTTADEITTMTRRLASALDAARWASRRCCPAPACSSTTARLAHRDTDPRIVYDSRRRPRSTRSPTSSFAMAAARCSSAEPVGTTRYGSRRERACPCTSCSAMVRPTRTSRCRTSPTPRHRAHAWWPRSPLARRPRSWVSGPGSPFNTLPEWAELRTRPCRAARRPARPRPARPTARRRAPRAVPGGPRRPRGPPARLVEDVDRRRAGSALRRRSPSGRLRSDAICSTSSST